MDKYYQLLDANSANVSSLWKVSHVASMLFATISGFIAAYTLGKAIDAFNNRCILYAHIVFFDNTTLPTVSDAMRELPDYFHRINMFETTWGTLTKCYFCQFTPVMSMISSLIWGAFFIICSKGGAGYISDSFYKPWRIVYPAIVFTIITIGLLLLSTLELSSGINMFCAQFKDIFNTTECTNYIDEYTLHFSDTQKPLIIFLRASLIASIICLACWILQFLILMLRIICAVDFEMYKITVTFLNDSQESLQGVIDPDNMSFMDDNNSSISRVSITSRKSNTKRRFPKFSWSFFKKFNKFKRSSTSSSSSFDQYNMDIDDVISLNEPSTSSKFDIDKSSIMQSKSRTSFDLISIKSSHDKTAKHVGNEKKDEDIFFEETVFSSLFFGKKEKHAKIVEDTVIRESLSFVPHSSESSLSNVLYSHLIRNNANILENEIEIDNSDSNDRQYPLISSAQPNNKNHNESTDGSSSMMVLDHSPIDYTNRYQSFGFVSQSFPLPNNNSEIKSIEHKSDGDLEIVVQKDNQHNYFSKSNNLTNLSQESNSLPIQMVGYEPRTPYRENIDNEIVINAIDRSSNENFVIARNRTATMPNYEYISNQIKRSHVNYIPVNEEINIQETTSPILSYTENVLQDVAVMPLNEAINSNNDIHDSNAILSPTRNKHRTGRSQTMPYTIPGNIEVNEEIPPHEFREEPRNETNLAEAEEVYNELREILVRVYVVLWLTVLLRNIGSLM